MYNKSNFDLFGYGSILVRNLVWRMSCVIRHVKDKNTIETKQCDVIKRHDKSNDNAHDAVYQEQINIFSVRLSPQNDRLYCSVQT